MPGMSFRLCACTSRVPTNTMMNESESHDAKGIEKIEEFKHWSCLSTKTPRTDHRTRKNMTNATLSPQISISSAMLTRDVALQILHNNDLGAGNVTLRLRYIADHWTLRITAAGRAVAILLPLNELIRVRDCSPQWGARRPEADRGSCHDGSSDYQQLTAYARLAQQAMAEISTAEPTKLPTFCETGFNAGHTAMTFLMLGYRVHFDVAKNAYTPACARMLSQIWPDRFTLHVGDSRITIDAWVPPPATCDVVSVDGLRTQAAVLADARAFAEHARAHAMLLVDDTSPSYGPNLMAAWQLLVDGGEVAPRHCTFLGVVATIRGPRPKHYCEGRLVAQPVPNASQLRCPAPPAPISSCERVAVVVMSYAGGRLDTLVVTLRHYANAPVVQEVVLVWNKGKAPRRVRSRAAIGSAPPHRRVYDQPPHESFPSIHPSGKHGGDAGRRRLACAARDNRGWCGAATRPRWRGSPRAILKATRPRLAATAMAAGTVTPRHTLRRYGSACGSCGSRLRFSTWCCRPACSFTRAGSVTSGRRSCGTSGGTWTARATICWLTLPSARGRGSHTCGMAANPASSGRRGSPRSPACRQTRHNGSLGALNASATL